MTLPDLSVVLTVFLHMSIVRVLSKRSGLDAQVEAFRKELNDLSNELRLLQQHTAEQQSSVLVQKG